MTGSADPQQDAVYTMESEELGLHSRHTVAIKELRKWARHLCKTFGVPPPAISVRSLRGMDAVYYDTQRTIVLDTKEGKNGLTLAHELAHHVTTIKHPRAADHGPTFMRYYATMLDCMRLVPVAGVAAACRKHGVKMSAVPAKVPTPGS